MTSPRFSVVPGQRFGRLVVQEKTTQKSPSGVSRGAARCVCDCGNEVTVLLQNLKDRTRSCGCLKRRGTMSERFAATRGSDRQFSVAPGDRFERLTVLRETTRRRTSGEQEWVAECACDCGAEATVTLANLRNGQVRSCGCLQRQRAAETNTERATHALSEHEHYPRWRNMIRRCHDPRDPRYPGWGGRGIAVCPEWHDAVAFVSYLENTLGPRPAGHSLDRIDNDGDYEPGNIRWASVLTQRHNQRRGATWGERTPRTNT